MSKTKTENSEPWIIFNHETFMLFHSTFLLKKFERDSNIIDLALNNALVESVFLHMRVLSDIILSRHKNFEDDINLKHLIGREYYTKYLKDQIKNLKKIYETRKTPESPCWLLNKILTHPSKFRKVYDDYTGVFITLFPILHNILKEIYTITKNNELKQHLEFAKDNI